MVEFRMLGPLDLRRISGGAAQVIRLQPKRLALLGYLGSAAPNRSCRRDALLAMFWPDADERRARNALNQAVHEVRRELGSDALVSHGVDGLELSPESFWCDAAAFDRALAQGERAEALDLYRGPLLDGVHVDGAAAFESWLDVERERLRERACAAASELADEALASDNPVGAVRWLRRILDIAPDREPELHRLMELLEATGDSGGALREYESAARRLDQEYDAAPSAETRALARRIRDAREVAAIADDRAASVAVLPFKNLSADPEQEYFCDGLTEEIINGLSTIGGLRVAARTSAFVFKHQSADLREVGRKLDVEHVLEGSVRRSGNRLRIAVQLINTANGYHVWSERYDRLLADVFDIQDEIARAIAERLQVHLVGGTERLTVPRGTERVDAYTLYLRGLFLLNKRTPDAIRKACEYFGRAIELDDQYARAYAALGFCYVLGGYFLYDVFAPDEALPLARAAVERALELDDELADAYVALGVVHFAFERDREAAERALRRALELNPNSAQAQAQYAIFLILSGRFGESDAVARRAEALDPLALMPKVFIGLNLLLQRRYREAHIQFEATSDMEPRFFVPHLLLGDVHRFAGQFEESAEAYQRAVDLIGRQPLVLGRIGALYASSGRRAEATAVIDELERISAHRHVLPTFLADVHVALEDYDAMYACLENARAVADTQLSMFLVWPAYDAVVSDSRFQAVLRP